MKIEDVGALMKIPVNLKDRDSFHLTIEEYLLALISVIDELVRCISTDSVAWKDTDGHRHVSLATQ